MLLSQMPNLYILHHPEKGRCVHCAEDIPKGALIEICNVIVLSKEDATLIHKTHLHDYYFLWDEKIGSIGIALGYGSLYNHSSSPNAETESMIETDELRILATRDIPAGEEITFDYQGTMKDTEIWFAPLDS